METSENLKEVTEALIDIVDLTESIETNSAPKEFWETIKRAQLALQKYNK